VWSCFWRFISIYDSACVLFNDAAAAAVDVEERQTSRKPLSADANQNLKPVVFWPRVKGDEKSFFCAFSGHFCLRWI
jgi:hypothetical protein